MSNIIHAVFEHGVFRPIGPVDLPESTHVEFEPRVVADVTNAASSFWRSKSLDELAAEQGVAPTTDLDAIADLWPADDDPDQLFDYLQHERAARRKLVREDRSA